MAHDEALAREDAIAPREAVSTDRGPVWVPFSSRRFRIGPFIGSLVALALCGFSVVVTCTAVIDGDGFSFAYGVSYFLFSLMFAVPMLSFAGIYSGRVRGSIKTLDCDRYGPGLVVPHRRFPLMHAGMLGLAGIASVFAIMGFAGVGPPLGVRARGVLSHPPLAAVTAAAVLALVISYRFGVRTDIALHARGLLRRTRKLGWLTVHRTEQFVPWDDMASLGVEMINPLHAARYMRPAIRITAPRALNPDRKLQPFETADSVVVLTFVLAADPNALISLIMWCKDNPESRELLQRIGARDLLKPPPLLRRLRLSRNAARSAS